MTNQEAFEKSVRHVMAQTERCTRGTTKPGVCAYAGPNETACGVGVLLKRETAELLDETFGDFNWPAIVRCASYELAAPARKVVAEKAVAELSGVNESLLGKLQLIHDRAPARDERARYHMLRQYRSLAREFMLDMPTIDNDPEEPEDER